MGKLFKKAFNKSLIMDDFLGMIEGGVDVIISGHVALLHSWSTWEVAHE